MIRYLLDTNAISDVIRDPHGRVGQRLVMLTAGECVTSIIVAAELAFGSYRRGDVFRARLDELFELVRVLPLEPPADRAYGRLRHALQAEGQPIGANDLLIAAHALALNLVLVTDNEREFGRVPGLRVENWSRP